MVKIKMILADNIILACAPPCTECSGNPIACTSCDISIPYLYGTTCLGTCPSHTYLGHSNICLGKLILEKNGLLTLE